MAELLQHNFQLKKELRLLGIEPEDLVGDGQRLRDTHIRAPGKIEGL